MKETRTPHSADCRAFSSLGFCPSPHCLQRDEVGEVKRPEEGRRGLHLLFGTGANMHRVENHVRLVQQRQEDQPRHPTHGQGER